jgi:hypothetical protein
VVALSTLSPEPSHEAARGASDNAFDLLFSLPFDRRAVAYYQLEPGVTADVEAPSRFTLKDGIGVGLLIAGAGLLTGAVVVSVQASQLASGVSSTTPQAQVDSINGQLTSYGRTSGILYGVGAAAVVGGAIALFWPHSQSPAALTAGSGGSVALLRF